MRSSLFFGGIMQRVVVLLYRRFGTTYRFPKRRYGTTLLRYVKSQKSADIQRFFFFLTKSKQKRDVLYEVTGICTSIWEGRTNAGRLVSLATNYVMYDDSKG